jgi:hypothetical protein
MNNKGKKRTDIKYIAVLFTAIMIFSSIGILFGNVQIGNNSNNTNFTPASNPTGTLELQIPVSGGASLTYDIYSNGSIYLLPYYTFPVYQLDFNITYDGTTATVLNYIYGGSGDAYAGNLVTGIWITNGTPAAYNALYSSGQTPTSLIPISEYINYVQESSSRIGMFNNEYSGAYSQNFVINPERANQATPPLSNTGDWYPLSANFYYIQNEIGQTSTVSAAVSGGTSPYYYQWYVNGIATGANLTTDTTYSYTSNSVSQANIICKITDSTGAVQWSEPDFIMTNPHTTLSLSSLYSSRDVGESNIFTTTVSTNFNPVYLNYTVNGIKKTSTSSTTFTYTFATAGVHTIEVYGIDSNGYNATYTMKYTIYADPILSALWTSNSVHINNNIKATDVNIPIYISSNASLGSGGYSYSWSGTGVSSVNSNTLTYIPTTASATGYVITLTVIDSNGIGVAGTITIIVNTDMSIVITTTTTGQ